MLKKFKTYQLAMKAYKKGQKLKLSGPIKDQFDRASLSIVLNLAEGSGKETYKDRLRFYRIAFGPIREVQALTEIIGNSNLQSDYDVIGACCWKLCQNPRTLTP